METEKIAAAETIAKLESQIENLNKGIAATRDESKVAVAAAQAATKALEDFSKNSTVEKKAEDVTLSTAEEKKFDAWARANGVVTQTDLDAERVRIANDSAKGFQAQAVMEFLETHPEYDSDEEWAKVQTEFDLYKTPSDLIGYKKLLDKVHKELSPDSKANPNNEDGRAAARAEIAKREALKRGGGGQSNAGGDNEAEIEKLQAKYPNLSREQITTRLSEVRALTNEKK